MCLRNARIAASLSCCIRHHSLKLYCYASPITGTEEGEKKSLLGKDIHSNGLIMSGRVFLWYILACPEKSADCERLEGLAKAGFSTHSKREPSACAKKSLNDTHHK